LTHDQLAQEMVLGKTASDIFNLAKKIVLPRHVGIIKSKVLKIPEQILGGETPIVIEQKSVEQTPAQ